MRMRTLWVDDSGALRELDGPPEVPPAGGWAWCDIMAGAADVDEVMAVARRFDFDELAVSDALVDVDLPKLNDFVHHLLIVFHGLRSDRVATYEVHCLVAPSLLMTIRDRESSEIDEVWQQTRLRPRPGDLGIDEVTALVGDALTRSLLRVVDAFDDRIDELTTRALRADSAVLEDLVMVRTDLASVRRIVHPQRETLDVLRRAPTPLLGPVGRRRMSDVFDLAVRVAVGVDEARADLTDVLDAYRGAEARQATEVTKVLTMYAAIMLPLSLIAGVFGMNFTRLPWLEHDRGWLIVVGLMLVLAFLSFGMFVALGWIKRPTGRRTGHVIGRGLLEATRMPVHLVETVVETSLHPLRSVRTAEIDARRDRHRLRDGDTTSGSE